MVIKNIYQNQKGEFMINQLLNQLEERVEQASEIIELLRMENAELKEQNNNLKAEQQGWESKLTSVLGKFDGLSDDTDEEEPQSSEAQAGSTFLD